MESLDFFEQAGIGQSCDVSDGVAFVSDVEDAAGVVEQASEAHRRGASERRADQVGDVTIEAQGSLIDLVEGEGGDDRFGDGADPEAHVDRDRRTGRVGRSRRELPPLSVTDEERQRATSSTFLTDEIDRLEWGVVAGRGAGLPGLDGGLRSARSQGHGDHDGDGGAGCSSHDHAPPRARVASIRSRSWRWLNGLWIS